MKRLIALSLFVCSLAFAQTRDYVIPYAADLTSTAAIVSVQQPTSSAAGVVRITDVYVYCSAACTFTLERTGTAATATTATVVPINVGQAAARVTAWTASNAGAGTVLGTYALAAGGSKSFPLNLALVGTATVAQPKNFTVRTAAVTGTVHIIIAVREEN